MKGRKDCYAKGGAAKTRDVGGVTAPIYGQSSKVMEIAKKSSDEGKVGMKGIGVDGVPIKGRADRPGRKMKKD